MHSKKLYLTLYLYISLYISLYIFCIKSDES